MIPTLGAAGKYAVSAPFSLDSNKAYKCTSVSFMQSLLDKSVDVYTLYYQPNGLTEAVYNEDLSNNVAMVTLKSSDGDIVVVPSTYITLVPTEKEVPYRRFGVLFEFGLLPSDTSFTYLLEQMNELSKLTLGVEPNSALATLPFDGFVSQEEHAIKITEREVDIKYNNSPSAALAKSLKTEQELRQHIAALEDIIKQLS